MPESRKNGGESNGTSSVYVPEAVADTHESGEGAGGKPGAKADGDLKKGDTLGRYLVLEQLGAGAMGVVYAAYDPELDRKIAIKILRPHEGKGDRARRQERLVREAKAMAKLSHPNVGAIYDVGVHGDQVFLAMEFLSGGTLRDWVTAKKRPWREIVKMFIEVGKGLAGAHAEGLIHRDFKPDNVLIDKNGVPKVVDFGLVRLTSAALDQSTTGSIDADTADTIEDGEVSVLPVAKTALAALTRTGALTGTPAYMAPEQFLGKAIDARTDQFAFCIALYEALYGERPFPGDTVIGLADAVTSQRIKPIPKTDVPTWIRRCLVRGLQADPSQRYPNFDALLATLRTDPVARLKRRVGATAAVVIVLAALVVIQQRADRRRQEIDRQVADHLAAADRLALIARQDTSRYAVLRDQAFVSFDRQMLDEGERLWDLARSASNEATVAFQGATERVESAVSLSHREDVRDRLFGFLVEQLLAAEQMRSTALTRDVRRKLEPLATSPQKKAVLTPQGAISFAVSPVTTNTRLERYVRTADGTLSPVAVGALDAGTATTQLQAGTYRLTLDLQGLTIRYPFTIGRNDSIDVVIHLKTTSLPKGFALVPAGRFLFGDEDEDLRQSFLKTTPLHESSTDSFLIGRTEVTYRDWIAYLDEADQGDRRLWPAVDETHGSSLGGSVRLVRENDRWILRLSPATVEYRAARGEPIRYRRKTGSVQDWLSMPVTGISGQEMKTYLKWLDDTGRVPGARLCSELEWERAARGADDRVFPHGYSLRPSDANHDATYGRVPEAFGPDEVCTHTASNSPFDLCDMAGNVLELTTSSLRTGEFVIRGGGYYFFRNSERATNREPFLATARSAHVGFRVCADAKDFIDVSSQVRSGGAMQVGSLKGAI